MDNATTRDDGHICFGPTCCDNDPTLAAAADAIDARNADAATLAEIFIFDTALAEIETADALRRNSHGVTWAAKGEPGPDNFAAVAEFDARYFPTTTGVAVNVYAVTFRDDGAGIVMSCDIAYDGKRVALCAGIGNQFARGLGDAFEFLAQAASLAESRTRDEYVGPARETIDITPSVAGYAQMAETFIDSIVAYSTPKNRAAVRGLLTGVISITAGLVSKSEHELAAGLADYAETGKRAPKVRA